MSSPSIDSGDLVAALRRPESYPHAVDGDVIVHETHISWIFLAGEFAYKIKKPVSTSFLDYSTLARREHCCREEIRLDQRFTEGLYLGVSSVTLDGGQLRIDGRGEAVEFAVKMRRFPEDALLSHRLDQGKLSSDEVFQLAGAVAHFHGQAAKAQPDSPWGSPQNVRDDAIDNLRHLQSSPAAEQLRKSVEALDRWTSGFFETHQMLIAQRPPRGFIRECHGDLHLDNVIHWHDRLMPFDGIEFNDEFRWIDVLSDAAFLAMDFAARGHPDLCRSFMNAYLELTGDHSCLPLLRWYLVYRALVRAKVAAIRSQQESEQPGASAAVADCLRHISLASRFTHQREPMLWITHGISGSGKTYGSELLVRRQGAIRLRSDIERKRQFGMTPQQRPDERTREKLYSESTSKATYERLRWLARGVLQSGYPVIVDAAFLKRHQREQFRELAADQGAGFAILNFQADQQTLRQRVADREARGDDASDADVDVIELQLAACEPLIQAEMEDVVEIPDAVSEIRGL